MLPSNRTCEDNLSPEAKIVSKSVISRLSFIPLIEILPVLCFSMVRCDNETIWTAV